MEYKGNWPKNYDTSIKSKYYTKVFFTKCASLSTVYFTKLKKNYYSGLLLSCVESDLLCCLKRKYST